MAAILVNPPPATPPAPFTFSSALTPGEYVDEGGPQPSDAPSGYNPGWHLIVENPQGSVLLKQTLVVPPIGGDVAPLPEIMIFVRYYAPIPGRPNVSLGGVTGDTQWTSWQQVPA